MMRKLRDPLPTKQEITANQCPMNCGGETAVLIARPRQPTIGNWWSRCQRCLAYWETSPAGKVLVLRVIEYREMCPDCLGPKDYSERLGHVCAKK